MVIELTGLDTLNWGKKEGSIKDVIQVLNVSEDSDEKGGEKWYKKVET